MHRYLLLIILQSLALTAVQANEVKLEEHQAGTITVSGSVTIDVVPDEVHLFVTIREYYVEELSGSVEPKEFKNKVSLSDIEKEFMSSLKALKISNELVTTHGVGSRWRERGCEYLKSKQFDLCFSSVSEAERVADGIMVQGIEAVSMGDFSHKQLAAIREKGKVEALLAARRKASALLKAVGKHLGGIVEIVEPEDQMYDMALDEAAVLSSNAKKSGGGGAGVGRIQKVIPLRYTMRATFRIED